MSSLSGTSARDARRPAATPRTGDGGFTIVELMVVVAVLAIVIAIAVPSLIRSRMAANEASAMATLRNVATVNEHYKLRFRTYAGALTDLQSAGYVDAGIGAGSKAGYTFSYSGSSFAFSMNAAPQVPGVTGTRYFFVDVSGVIRFSTSGAASSASPPIGE